MEGGLRIKTCFGYNCRHESERLKGRWKPETDEMIQRISDIEEG